jgi:NAD(P)-dependent dehydrogenase (short-subunit alcohol dehydrogenase family)
MKTLDDRWALVTGSSRGIGRQIALGLAARKCNLILHGRAPGNTDGTAKMLIGAGVKVRSVSGELESPEGIAGIVDGVRRGPGEVDILYNNAAVQNVWTSVWDIPLAEWQAVFQVNLFAVVALCNAFVPGMVRRGFGRIVNVSSGIRDTPSLAPYSVSKAAIDKYTADLAAELKGTNVLVNCMDPGWLRTDMGGPNAEHPVESVLPGALVPVLLDEGGPSGRLFAAQDYAMLG